MQLSIAISFAYIYLDIQLFTYSLANTIYFTDKSNDVKV